MIHYRYDVTRFFPQRSESLLHYWVSFSPAAPLFGVKWRFAPDDDYVEVDEEVDEAPAPKTAPVVMTTPKPTFKPAPRSAPTPEVVAPAPPPAEATPEPAAVAKPAPKPEPAPVPDDLTQIKGIGPKIAAALSDAGLVSFAQIAAIAEDEITPLEERIGAIPGRILRDDWRGQARALLH